MATKAPRKLPRQPRAQVTVDAILQATEELVVADGVEALSLNAVAKRAGVSPGTLYQYFGTLPAVLAAWEERAFARDAETFRARVVDLLARRPGPETSVKELVALGFDIMLGRMRYYRDTSSAELVSRLAVRVDVASTYVDAIAMGMMQLPAHRLRRSDHAVAARIILLAVSSAAHHAWAGQFDEPFVLRMRTELSVMIASYLLNDAAG